MKDWKGNKNAAHAAIAAKKPGSTTIRETDDFYATDPKALEALLKNCSIWLETQLLLTKPTNRMEKLTYLPDYIWECACGNGNLVKVLSDSGFNVYATDIKDRGCGVQRNLDFLHTNQYHGRIILTNPPYSLATEFIEHALELLPDGGLYIALMNITYLHGIDRYKRVYSKGTLREVYVHSKKINVYKNNIPTGNTSMCVYAWYVFQKGYVGRPTLYWL